MDLETPIRSAGVTYRLQAKKLERLGIFTLRDLLFHIPQRYEDLSLVSKINILQPGETVTIQGTVEEIKNEYTRKRFVLQKAIITDETGSIECVWFNQPFITRVIKKGNRVSLAGKVDQSGRNLNLKITDYEVLPNFDSIAVHTARLVPIYPETRGLSSKWIRNRIKDLIAKLKGSLIEYLPASIIEKNNLPTIQTALEHIHFPIFANDVIRARERLAFEELFMMQLTGMEKRQEWEQKQISYPFSIAEHKENIQKFWENLPFELTNAQKRSVREIFHDLAQKKPMNRLLEGDVGAGKTVVATIAIYLAHLNGFESALMAPTEILAVQHYNTISNLLSPLGVRVELATGSRKSKAVKCNDILIGTHALLNEKIKFNKLGLVVIDEQQRFGVEHRAVLREKGTNPHFLTMTATPIPRTVFLTLYGDLDLSYLDEMPKGRQIVKTWLVPAAKREAAYEWIKKQIREIHAQIFIVCPFIEESESMQTVKAATKEYERLKNEVFQDFKVGLLHGRMKSKEKDEVLTAFRNHESDILVSTPVVEVGVDIPNATIMLIEAAERFGLAQLHQLRGRVGRSNKQSYCLLFTEQANEQTFQRLKSLERMYSGAELAELDLKLRGPGEMYGTRQHGAPLLKVASFSDFSLIEKTKRQAEEVFKHIDTYPELKERVKASIISKVTPD